MKRALEEETTLSRILKYITPRAKASSGALSQFGAEKRSMKVVRNFAREGCLTVYYISSWYRVQILRYAMIVKGVVSNLCIFYTGELAKTAKQTAKNIWE